MRTKLRQAAAKIILAHSEQDTLARARQLAEVEHISLEQALTLVMHRQALVARSLDHIINPKDV
jgi:hypothetical protein